MIPPSPVSEVLKVKPGQQGYTIASALVVLLIVTLFGTFAYKRAQNDLKLTLNVKKNVRANFVAESAVNWALAELRRPRGDWVPFSKATHDPTGTTKLDDTVKTGSTWTLSGRKLKVSEVFSVYPSGSCSTDANGWIYQRTTNSVQSISGLTPERLSFKVWYPATPVNSIRITAIGIAATDTVQVEFIGNFNDSLLKLPP